ncbi:MAG: GTPase Era [bacterium]
MKSGFVSLLGRPNTGKSTLLNRIIGSKIAITSPRLQTTRTKIMGIRNGPDHQIIFFDTPGLHKAPGTFNKRMLNSAYKAGKESDLLLYLVEASHYNNVDDVKNLKKIVGENIPIILIINKIDLVARLELLPQIDHYRQVIDFAEIFPLSALKGDNVASLSETIVKYLPEGPAYYPQDMITDQTERFIVAEFIREKLIKLTRQEVPYACATAVESMKVDEKKKIARIHATIIVKKESQRGILIGKSGMQLKEITRLARKEIESFLGLSVVLEIWVKVSPKWQVNETILKNFGY